MMEFSHGTKCSQVSGRVVNLTQPGFSRFDFVVDENLFLLQMFFLGIVEQRTNISVLFHEDNLFSLSPSLSTIAQRICLRFACVIYSPEVSSFDLVKIKWLS